MTYSLDFYELESMKQLNIISGKMLLNDLLTADAKILGQDIILGQGGQIPILIGSVHPFVHGMVIAQVGYDLFDELLMLDKVTAPQMIDSRLVPVYQVMDLLGKPIVVGHIDDQVGKYLNRFIVFNMFLDFPNSGRSIAKDHGHP